MPQEGTTNEDRFTGINPEDLAPELQQLYKMMQRDYTKKRQAESQELKELKTAVQQMRAAVEERDKFIEESKLYITTLEDANMKWRQWHDSTEEQRQKFEAAAKGGNGNGQQQQQQFTKQEQEILRADPANFTKEQLSKLDEYFSNKFGGTFQELGDELKKVKTQLKFSNQLNDIFRKWGNDKDLKVDQDAILKKAIERGDPDAMAAFQDLYGETLRKKEVDAEVERRWQEKLESEKKTALEGISRPQTFYTRPEQVPRSYEEATAMTLGEIAAGKG